MLSQDTEGGAVGAAGLTVATLFGWLTGGRVSDDLLDWAPDVAALTTVLLERSQAFRFVVSPPEGERWPPEPPEGGLSFADEVTDAASEWCERMDARRGGAPEAVARRWATVVEHLDTPIEEMAAGRPWALCEAVLALHAIADEASAGCSTGATRIGAGSTQTARARELLALTGTMARLPADRLTHLPKTRTTPVGMTHRSLSRYSCTPTDGIPAVWHRAPIRRPGSEPGAQHANVLLLPWPLRIRESDFVPVPGSVRRPERDPFGFFRYEPSEPLDLDLVDRLLDAALDEVDNVDVVVLPEGFLDEREVPAFEGLLARRGVALFITGMRLTAPEADRFPGNGVHIGVLLGGEWWHYRQNKHHRWFLDAGQIEQYNIAGALHPHVRWWEAMEIPRRSVHFLELGAGVTIAAVVCEDLARLDGVAELLRSVGPTLVVTLLLDGPQLASRWTARYAGVLADDPGSAVLTLTALGMATRSRPAGAPPSRVVAMWKDPVRGLREIPLEEGAQAVLLTAVLGRSARYAADGRAPADDATDLYVAGVHQLRAGPARTGPVSAAPSSERDVPAAAAAGSGNAPALDAVELSVLSSWTDAVAAALARTARHGVAAGASRDRAGAVDAVLSEAAPGAPWRLAAGIGEPPPRLASALHALARVTTDAVEAAEGSTIDELLAALDGVPEGDGPLAALVAGLLRAALDATRAG